MIIQDVILKIEQRLNKKATSDYDNVPVFEQIEAYNKATINVVLRLHGLNNMYKHGVESTRKRVEDLKFLINKDPLKLRVTRKDGYYLTENMPADYLLYIRSYSIAKNEQCPGKQITNYLGEESNINTLLGNDNTNPNFEWGETVITLVDHNIKVYTENKFDIVNVYLTYLRYPRKVDIQGYIKPDGSNSTNIDPDLPDYIVEMCIDEAVRIISGDIENQFGNSMAQQNLSQDE